MTDGFLVVPMGRTGTAAVACPGCDTEARRRVGQNTCACGTTFTIIPEIIHHQ